MCEHHHWYPVDTGSTTVTGLDRSTQHVDVERQHCTHCPAVKTTTITQPVHTVVPAGAGV